MTASLRQRLLEILVVHRLPENAPSDEYTVNLIVDAIADDEGAVEVMVRAACGYGCLFPECDCSPTGGRDQRAALAALARWVRE